MNDTTNTPPVFPPAMSSNKRSKRFLLIVGIIGGLAIGGASWLLGTTINHFDAQNGTNRIDGLTPLLLFSLLAIALAGGLMWSLKFWRTIDEAARRAHLDAFYWGGSISWIVIAPFSVLPLKINGFHLPFIEAMDMTASQTFALGIWAAIIVTLIGYGVAWLIWWSTKR
jgi:hypothetical protein